MILETSRLVLRELTPADADFAFDLNNDPEVLRFTGDQPFESIEAARIFLENYSDYSRNGFGRWMMIDKMTGESIGWYGLKLDRETDEVDIGYRLFRRHWNKGYATEEAEACLLKGFTDFGLTEIIGRARRENAASIRVLGKLGMTFKESFIEDGHPWACYEKKHH